MVSVVLHADGAISCFFPQQIDVPQCTGSEENPESINHLPIIDQCFRTSEGGDT